MQQSRKIALYAAEINIVKARGITVQDLVEKGFGKDNAQMLLPKAVKNALLHDYFKSFFINVLLLIK